MHLFEYKDKEDYEILDPRVPKVMYDKEDIDAYIRKLDRRHKYKRCLAMAKWCGSAYDKWMMKKAKAIGLGKEGVEYYRQARWKVLHYMRWLNLWFKIAERFKEVK